MYDVLSDCGGGPSYPIARYPLDIRATSELYQYLRHHSRDVFGLQRTHLLRNEFFTREYEHLFFLDASYRMWPSLPGNGVHFEVSRRNQTAAACQHALSRSAANNQHGEARTTPLQESARAARRGGRNQTSRHTFFATAKALRSHLFVDEAPKKVVPTCCLNCSANSAQRSMTSTGSNTLAVEKPYKCLDCPARFAKTKYLHVHKRVHSGEKSYACPEFSSKCSQKGTLDRHLRVLSGEKPHPCDECGKSFANLRNLGINKRTHSGEEPYACPECPKKFATKHTLTVHRRVHTGEKPYALQRHKQIHTGERPFLCSGCPATFAREFCLIVHRRIHRGEKPYPRDECERKIHILQQPFDTQAKSHR